MKIYVASSWRNERQPAVVKLLRELRHKVYDFRNPTEKDRGFAWADVDPDWQWWSSHEFVHALDHFSARRGYALDKDALDWADACVLVNPCGRSAHLEFGYMVGRGKPAVILLNEGDEPELMYRMATFLAEDFDELVRCFDPTVMLVLREGQRRAAGKGGRSDYH